MPDPRSASNPTSPEGTFSERPLPVAPPTAADLGQFSERPPKPMVDSGAVPARSPLRLVVPLVLFVVIIGGIAWVVQNMPSWRSNRQTIEAPANEKGPEILIKIGGVPHNRGMYLAMWEPMPAEKVSNEKQFYAREYERDGQGEYHFPFKILSEQPIEFGVTHKSCDCARLHVAVVSEAECTKLVDRITTDPSQEFQENPAWDWKPLDNTKEHGVTLPGGAFAIVRMTWKNRRQPGEPLNLGAQLWTRSASVTRKQEYGLRIDSISTQPMRTRKDHLDVGGIEPGFHATAEFVVWSPTRDELKFKMAQDDPLFELTVKQFDADACADLQKKLRQGEINTRVRAAWTVLVQVHENKRDRQLDQGYFNRGIQVLGPGIPDDVPALVVTGTVKSDFVIGAQNDQGKINLGSFKAAFGTQKSLVVTSQTNAELDPAKIEFPAGLKVQLVETAKRKWSLSVTVPPNRFSGGITDDNVVILHTKSGRPIRIPLMGTATQG